MWWLLLACGGPGADDGSSISVVDSTAPTTDTAPTAASTGDTASPTLLPTADTGPPPVGLQGSCELAADNALRAWCDLTVDTPAAVEVAFAPVGGGTQRVHRSDAPATDHRVGLFIMQPETDYTWTASVPGTTWEASGTFTTGSLPLEAQLAYVDEGTATHRLMLHASPCQNRGMVVVTDTEEGVVWYHAFPPEKVIAMHHTVDDTIATMVGSDIVEVDWMGQPVRTLTAAHNLHHDFFRTEDGLTYALFKEVWAGTEPYTVDGFVVLDTKGAEIGVWRLADHIPPTRPDPAHGIDIHHSNSIHVQDGVALISVRHTSTILAVAADPTLPDFGTILWRLGGDPDDAAQWGSDYTLTASAGGSPTFKEQHHAVMQPDGRLTLFDNRIGLEQNSRGLVLSLDGDTADIEHVYELPAHCNYQGGLTFTPGGNAVLNCADRGLGFEYDSVSAELVWRTEATCTTGVSGMIPRFLPVEP